MNVAVKGAEIFDTARGQESAARLMLSSIAALVLVVAGCGTKSARPDGATGTGGAGGELTGAGGHDAGAGGSDLGAGGSNLGAGGSNLGAGGRDAGSPEGPASDAAIGQFPGVVYDAVWLIGWSGGLDHYEWTRFSPAPGGAAGTWIAAAALCRTCDCRSAPCGSRSGTFTVVGPDTLHMQLAADAGGPAVGDYRFTNFRPALGTGFSVGADLQATVELAGLSSYDAFRFPAGHCSPDLASCPALN